ncbi:NAD(P)-dependent alcohol dehydrogenase [Herbiconiux ginsengi]|uniref:NADPH:quinone reductase n=1 Tax=Herbiconiux ginsengi TaxID=381665 RepID=A0A1H3PGJ3_9MICO|nr:NAD(P)-dependent alcohol dehydrogenase [Herbiconiux ginsengi]SDZ00246.1 NADPH:quinone reductase [Herbiconiux ginsengi]
MTSSDTNSSIPSAASAATSASRRSAAPTTPSTMRAVTQSRYGSPDALRVSVRPVPQPGPGEVRVRVRAAGVDAGTWHLVTGKPYLMRFMGFGLRGPRSGTLGLAFAGEVEAVGTAVTAFSPGDRVFGSGGGAFAEFVCAPQSMLARMPAGLGFEAAATLPVSGVTAIQAVRDAGEVHAGQNVLVIGAGGGVGSFAVQLAVAAGAAVTAVCSGSKAAFVERLGASEIVDYTRADVTALDRRWDVIIDIAGNRRLSRLRRILAPRGTLVLVGGENGGPVLGGMERVLGATLLNAFTRQRLRGLVSRENAADFEALADAVTSGAVIPAIDAVRPLEQVAAAVNHVAEGRARGKVVLVPSAHPPTPASPAPTVGFVSPR